MHTHMRARESVVSLVELLDGKSWLASAFVQSACRYGFIKAGVTLIVVEDVAHSAVFRRPKGSPELAATPSIAPWFSRVPANF